MKKAKRRHNLAYYVIEVFVFAIECMLGLNAAFLIDQSVAIVADHMLAGTWFAPLAAYITLFVSLAVGVCFVAGGVWTFTGFMDSLDDAKAYSDTYGAWLWPQALVWAALVAVIGLDFTTLAFRATFFAERGATALFVFFCILIFLPFVLGLLMHVLEHTPADRRRAKVRVYAEALEEDDFQQAVETMSPDLRSRLLSGDQTAIDDHYARIAQQRQAAREYEEQKIKERDAKKQEREDKQRNKQRGFFFFGHGRQSNQAQLSSPNDSVVSQNGHR